MSFSQGPWWWELIFDSVRIQIVVKPRRLLVTPLFPALRSDPMALSGASRTKQIPSS